MNIMYFKLCEGEEAKPLRNMALENFPNANLKETEIVADDYGSKDVLYHILTEIKRGKYDKLYITNPSVFGRTANEMCDIIGDIGKARPGFMIEMKDDICFEPAGIDLKTVFDGMDEQLERIIAEAKTKMGIGDEEQDLSMEMNM